MEQQSEQTRTAPAWRILRVEDTATVVGVQPMYVKRVWLQLFDDTTTYVDVPRDSYTAGHVAQLAEELAKAHYAVVSMQGPEISFPV